MADETDQLAQARRLREVVSARRTALAQRDKRAHMATTVALAEAVPALLDRVDAIEALHERVRTNGHSFDSCLECSTVWPCPTLRALGVES